MDVENKDRKSRPGEEFDTAVTSVDFDQPDSMVGRTLDERFVIEKNLTDGGADEGGIGVVYLARDTKMMNKRVVVKILQEAALKYKDILRKFLHEEEALMRLDHPGIVRILDFGKLTDGNPFMVMEYIEGYSLRKALRTQSPFSLEFAAHLIESITDALSAAHAEKIIHRDIKPENIMLTPQEGGFARVRLIDFGIARVDESTLAPVTEISRAIGTVRYIAPEQLAGSLYLAPSADIYSAGVVAYEMLTGQLPFKPETMVHMYRLQQEGLTTTPRELRQEIPPAAEEILLSALEFDAENRPQNAREFGRNLARSLRSARLAPLHETEDVSTYRTELAGDEVVTALRADSLNTIKGKDEKSSLSVKWIAAGVIGFAALVLTTGLVAWNFIGPPSPTLTANPSTNSSPTPAGIGADREISYHLMIQKMRDGKKFEEPFKSSGQEIVGSGDTFRLFFEPDADGFMWIFNETKNERGEIAYNLLFPTPKRNNGSSKITAKQEIETAPNNLGGKRGTEVILMIWSKEKNTGLDDVIESAFKTDGKLEETSLGTLKRFLDLSPAEKPEARKDSINQRTVVRTRGDLVVHRFELEHR